jgi:ligand-binding sensor domain-containing protein
MPLLKIIFFCFCLCISANAAFSQSQTPDFITDQYRAVLWSKSDGLSDDILNVMIKDVKGFLWIASDDNGKLTRFDGMNFKKYTLDPKKPINATGKIMALKEDSLHNIWIGT